VCVVGVRLSGGLYSSIWVWHKSQKFCSAV
jgi:hypothetical protein